MIIIIMAIIITIITTIIIIMITITIQFLLHTHKKNFPHFNSSGILCNNFVSNSPGFHFSAIYFIKNYLSLLRTTRCGIVLKPHQPLRKISKFLLIFWCGIFVEQHSFRIVSGESPKTMRKLCLSTKFRQQEIR